MYNCGTDEELYPWEIEVFIAMTYGKNLACPMHCNMTGPGITSGRSESWPVSLEVDTWVDMAADYKTVKY